jgi:hypothetical protein
LNGTAPVGGVKSLEEGKGRIEGRVEGRNNGRKKGRKVGKINYEEGREGKGRNGKVRKRREGKGKG